MSKPFSDQTPLKTSTYLPFTLPKTIFDKLEEAASTSALPNSSPSPPLLAPATTPASKSPDASVASAAILTPEARVVIAVDYGTTFTGVAYLVVKHKDQDLDGLANDIKVIQSWKKHSAEKVPSDYSYSPSLVQSCDQWGYDIDDNSRVLRWTKLSLQPSNDRTLELQNLKNLLYEIRHVDLSPDKVINNDLPRHLWKEPEDVVTDYLENVAEKTLDEITSQVGRDVLDNIPIDIVVSHPAKWSNKALNSEFHAITTAFNDYRFSKIRDISFVSEPEACAHYTLRVAWQEGHLKFRKNDCFVVVDAGGGTVDIASYKVVGYDNEKKQIKLEQVGIPIGRRCGATFIDKAFTGFVQGRLGKEDWAKLTGSEDKCAASGHNIVNPKVRMLQEQFEQIKHRFEGKEQNLSWPIQLPSDIDINDSEEGGILDGAIKLTTDDVKEMFAYSVDNTLILISQAMTQIEVMETGLKVRKIFLSGGFGQSPYLFERVRKFGNIRRVAVDRGDDCWAAVAKGAIIKSLGLYTDKPPVVKICPRHYGIKVRSYSTAPKHEPPDVDVDTKGVRWAPDQIRWFGRKGDIIFPNRPLITTHHCHWSMKASDFASAKQSLNYGQPSCPALREVVFVATPLDAAPMRLDKSNQSQSQVVILSCDLTRVPKSHINEFSNKKTGKYLKFSATIEIHVFDKVSLKVTSGRQVLCSKRVPL
ncbi:hypothetical protein B0T18DRAFT_440099 [Schizothecium vesticola]|uniref:Actin-like ATPase domain-containing protein n=1 Tax=Schizothecium vesticola TaxID=314040 RepID=A0AA40EJC8_9PEZI|nr:hypothetical protein B0T18DRAFT_440099 [Schizothecium vesticola]